MASEKEKTKMKVPFIDKYPVDINDETVFWGRIKKNYYWACKCGGKRHKIDHQLCFQTKKWKNGSNNSGPVGWKARREKRGKL
jgi:hypothetical protein